MKSHKTRLLICLVLFPLLGCAPVTIKYLEPTGEGKLSKHPCGGPKYRITFSPRDGVDLSLSAISNEKPEYLTITITIKLQEEVSFQFVSSQIILESSEYSKVEISDLGYIKAYSTGQPYQPTDKLVGYTYETKNWYTNKSVPEIYSTTIVKSEKTPKQFQLKLPDANINGSDIFFKPIIFKEKKGVYIVPFLCP